MALTNLVRRKVRALLTIILAVTIAITFTVSLLSVSEGFIIQVNEVILTQGEQIQVVAKEIALHPTPFLEAHQTFSLDLISEIREIENVKGVYSVLTQNIFLEGLPIPFLALIGIESNFLKDLRPYLKLEKGRMIEPEDKEVIIFSSTIAKTQNLNLGEKFNLKGRKLEIIGILETGGVLFEDMIVYLPLKTLQEIFEKENQISLAAITLENPDRTKETAKKIENLSPDLKDLSLEESLAQIMDYIGIARAVHITVASISLLIGILFVLSTMIMATSERVKEIATMKAIGASKNFVFLLILNESILIGFLAGLFGVIGGYFLSKGITLITSQFFGMAFIQPIVSSRLIITGFSILILNGILGGLFPAWKISKGNIAQSLKYE